MNETPEMAKQNKIIFVLFLNFFQSSFQEMRIIYGRAIPMVDKKLNAVPMQKLENVSAVQCASTCGTIGCKAYNYDRSVCELLDTYICDSVNVHSMVSSNNFRYYDVEYDEEDTDMYYDTADCTLHGRCSPKCYPSTTTEAATTTVPTTTSTPMTTTTPLTTTSTPETTTPLTTTSTPMTTTTTTPLTTTSTPTTTVNSLPINNPCSSSAQCTVASSECRDNTCQCIPGYTMLITGDVYCLSSACPGAQYSTSTNSFGFTKTNAYRLDDSLEVTTFTSPTQCMQRCIEISGLCLSVSYVSTNMNCYVSGNNKNSVASSKWIADANAAYYHRNCNMI